MKIGTTPTILISIPEVVEYESLFVTFKGTEGSVTFENPEKIEEDFHCKFTQSQTQTLGVGYVDIEAQIVFSNKSTAKTVLARIYNEKSIHTHSVTGVGGVPETETFSLAVAGEIVYSGEGGAGTTNHAALENLDYLNSGHTGFQSALTQEQLDNISDISGFIVDSTYNQTTGVLTLTKQDGSTITIDLPVENIISSGSFDTTTNEIVLELVSGEEIRIPASSLVDTYTGGETVTVSVAVNEGVITATVKSGSITNSHLSAELSASLNELTLAMHSHANKALLDSLTQAMVDKIAEIDDKADASDIPTVLPSPASIKFTGASTATYDGSVAVTVNIPEASGPVTTNHASLQNLDYANSNHTGFQASLSSGQLANIAAVPDKASQTDLEAVRTTANSAIQEETDPTVPAWAKASSKPSYTATEVGALPASTTIPTNTNQLTNGSGFINQTDGDARYERIIATKNTAFNKNFGSSAGTVVEGNRVLTDVPVGAVFTDTVYDDTPLSQEIARIAGEMDGKEDITTTRTITASTAATGVALVDNEDVTISAITTSINVTASEGTGTISLVAGATLSVTLPSGQGFAGLTPTSGTTYELEITEGLIYNMVYFKGTYYIDGGR